MNSIYNKKKKEINIHLVSDSTGETIENTVSATISQFPDVHRKEFFWPMTRTEDQIKDITQNLKKNPGLVVFSIVDDKNRALLEDSCKNMNMPFVSPLDSLLNILKEILALSETKITGVQHRLDENYFRRIDAFEFAMQHDDGQRISSMGDADIILVGVSRTSKTPTSIYLANKGLKVANIPLVANTQLPEELFGFKKPIIIGLIKDPRSLMQVRQTRLKMMGENNLTSYDDINHIKFEISQARLIYTKYGWPSVDVSRRSVEETSASVIKIYNNKGTPF
tara:strand:+ start:910 stop:1749 length:840 start_codon:yes stop_codon:yes gene_type:complete